MKLLDRLKALWKKHILRKSEEQPALPWYTSPLPPWEQETYWLSAMEQAARDLGAVAFRNIANEIIQNNDDIESPPPEVYALQSLGAKLNKPTVISTKGIDMKFPIMHPTAGSFSWERFDEDVICRRAITMRPRIFVMVADYNEELNSVCIWEKLHEVTDPTYYSEWIERLFHAIKYESLTHLDELGIDAGVVLARFNELAENSSVPRDRAFAVAVMEAAAAHLRNGAE